MELSNLYIFALMFGVCFLPIGDSSVTCIRDDFEEGYSVLLKEQCDAYRLKFIIKNYTTDDGIPAPLGSRFYLTDSLQTSSHCLMNESLTVKPGTRIVVNFLGYSNDPQSPPTCFIRAYNKSTHDSIGYDLKAFTNKKIWQNLTMVFNREAEFYMHLGCNTVYKGELLAIDYVLIEMDSEDDCESSGIVTAPPPTSTTPFPPTTTPMPEEPGDCETITTTTTTTNTVTTVVTKTTIKSNNPGTGYCPSKCC